MAASRRLGRIAASDDFHVYVAHRALVVRPLAGSAIFQRLLFLSPSSTFLRASVWHAQGIDCRLPRNASPQRIAVGNQSFLRRNRLLVFDIFAARLLSNRRRQPFSRRNIA